MAAEVITVYIDPTQIVAQKDNDYSLYLAKMVNGQFTVIWQSLGAVATVQNRAYYYLNVFNVTVPSYQVNYGTLTGSVTFEAQGMARAIDIGQTVTLDNLGLFGTPTNSGTPGAVTILNNLAGNPHAILLDAAGKPIFVNTRSGMNLGRATLTPVDTYQLWFDNLQDTGTIIAYNASNPKVVTFGGGASNEVVSFNRDGRWQDGPLSNVVGVRTEADVAAVAHPMSVGVLATFKYPLSVAAGVFLANRVYDWFGSLRPREIRLGGNQCEFVFDNPPNGAGLATGMDRFEAVVQAVLTRAKNDSGSDLQNQTWTLSEPTIC